METYTVAPEILSSSKLKAIRRLGILLPLGFCTLAIFLWLAPNPHNESFAYRIWNAAVPFFAAFGFAGWSGLKRQSYDFTVNEFEIRQKTVTAIRKVRRGEIQTFIERKESYFVEGGLFLSESGKTVARLFRGGVWIPKKLPEYEQIKNTASLWMRAS